MKKKRKGKTGKLLVYRKMFRNTHKNTKLGKLNGKAENMNLKYESKLLYLS